MAELRRRLGGAFTVDELPSVYEPGTAWCLDLAAEVAPGAPWAWDARVADAAFARYVRERGRLRRRAAARGAGLNRLVLVGVLVTGAADHDLVLLDVTATLRWPAQCSA